MADKVIVVDGFEYRYEGRQVLSRRKERDRSAPPHNSWVVLNHGEIIPPQVLQYLRQPAEAGLHFD